MLYNTDQLYDVFMYVCLILVQTFPGRIVNISSVHGRMYCRKMVNYEVAKHALETMSDSLRMEMKKCGLSVSIVEPGMFGFATSGLSQAVVSLMLQYQYVHCLH